MKDKVPTIPNNGIKMKQSKPIDAIVSILENLPCFFTPETPWGKFLPRAVIITPAIASVRPRVKQHKLCTTGTTDDQASPQKVVAVFRALDVLWIFRRFEASIATGLRALKPMSDPFHV